MAKHKKNAQRKLLSEKLSQSLSSEDNQVQARLAKAESIFAKRAEETEERKTEIPKKQPEKEKTVHQTFTFPESELRLIEKQVMRAAKEEVLVNKSEIIRVALNALSNLPDEEFMLYLGKLKRLTRGRK